MIRTYIQLEDGENVYKIGDKVRIKMISNNPKRANESLRNL